MVDVTTPITDRQIADLLCSAFEGGSDYWIHKIDVHRGKNDGRPYGEEYTPGYLSAPFSQDGYVDVDPGEGEPIVRLDHAALLKGLTVMAKDWPRHFGDALSESNADATTGDVFLQCCLFGDIIFG